MRTLGYWRPFFMSDADIPDRMWPAIRFVLVGIALFVFFLISAEKFNDGQYGLGILNAVLFIATFLLAVKWHKITAYLGSRKMISIFIGLAIVGALALGIAIGGLITNRYTQFVGAAPSTGRVVWNFDQTASGQGYFLNMTRLGTDEIRVAGFQAHGKNTSNDPISQFKGYIRSDLTNEELPIYLVAQANEESKSAPLPFPMPVPIPTLPDETYGIPALADFDITTFNKPIFESGKDGTPLSKFLSDFPAFTLVLEYDGTKIERHFSNLEIKKQIELFEGASNPQKNTNPRVLRKPDATPPIMPSFKLPIPVTPTPNTPQNTQQPSNN